MFIKQAVASAGRRLLGQKQITQLEDSILVQFLFFTTLKNYIYEWFSNEKILIVPEQIKQRAAMRKHILVLDMDETLVYTRREEKPSHSNYIRTQFEGENMYVEPRPFAKQFLKALSEIFTIYIYTAGRKTYADTVLNIIDPQGVIQKRFYRDSCRKVGGKLVKDLKYLKKSCRIKEQLFLVDDNTDSIEHNYPFAMKIHPFEGCQQDMVLLHIFDQLLKLYH